MKKILKLILIALAVLLTLTAAVSCGEKDEGEKDDPAVAAVKTLIGNYYSDINNGSYDGIGKYFSSDTSDIAEKISNFKFFSEYYTNNYEIDKVEALFLEDGNISASVTTIRTSIEKGSGKKTVVSEPSTYIIGKEVEGGDYVIISMAIGESSIIELET